jgi:serine phosphatase RsbU (regulator of sigma subunit)
MHRRSHFFLSLLIIFCVQLNLSAQTLDLSDSTQSYDLHKYLEILPVSEKNLPISQIINSQNDFVELNTDYKKFYQNEEQVFWFKLKVKNNQIANGKFLLKVPHIDYAYLYLQNEDKTFQKIKGGTLTTFEEREFWLGRHSYIPFDLPDGKETTLYLEVHFETPFHIQNKTYFDPFNKLTISQLDESLRVYNEGRYYQGLYFGAMFLMILYNLFLFIFTKDSNHIYYVLFIFGTAFANMIFEGYTLEILWQNNPKADLLLLYLAYALSWVFFTRFAIVFLNLKHHTPRWYTLLNVFIGIYVLLAILNFIGYWNLYLYLILFFITVSIIVFLTVRSLLRNYRPARYFLLANIFFILGNGILYATIIGVLPANSFTLHAEEVGDILQILFFSIALADRINLLRIKIAKQEEERKRTFENQKEKLELEVEVRTSELALSRKEIQKSYKNILLLSDMGRQITAALDLPTVIRTVYKNVNEVMDASIFGIGTINKDKKQIIYSHFFINGEEQHPAITISFEEENRLSNWCIENQEDIFINDFENEYSKYITSPTRGKMVEKRNSLIYIPLVTDKVLGILTVQSIHKNAYDEEDLHILESLAAYIAIALDNTDAYTQIQQAQIEIEHQNMKITDSLRYASDIQEVILPYQEEMLEMFPQHFVIYKPKDIVSGDFYWAKEQKGRKFIAVVDCTGHGVPGAFMSMVGTTLLNQVLETIDLTSGLIGILHALNIDFYKALKLDVNQNNDGMDVGICMIEDSVEDQDKVKVSFAGAKRPLHYSDKGEFMEAKGTRRSIGDKVKRNGKAKPFQQLDLLLDKGEMIYLGSDGLVDQASPEHKKIGTLNLKKFLEKNVDLDIEKQKNNILEYLSNHQQDAPQRDDITLVGIRV